jgi:hypothetical protein
MKTYLFTEGPVTAIEAEVEHGAASAGNGDADQRPSADGSLGIGSLRDAPRDPK